MTSWPRYTEINDVVLSPLSPSGGKSVMVLQASPASQLFQHHRYDGSNQAISIEPFIGDPTQEMDIVDDLTIYAGPLFRHFGHLLSESIHRLWPRIVHPELAGAKVAFLPVNKIRLLPYIVETLNLHGVSAKDVKLITRPTLFRRLIVAPQGRLMAGPTLNTAYPALLDCSLDRRIVPLGEGRKIYVSRSKHTHTGSYYGESYIEQFLSSDGFEIIWPEDYTVHDLVGIFRSSSKAVFAEGSAIHGLELCGTHTPDTFVIGRRRGSVPRFTPVLSSICRKFKVSDRWLFSDGMSEDSKKHSGFLDVYGVAAELTLFADVKAPLDPTAISSFIQEDVEAHIRDPRASTSLDRTVRAAELRQRIGSHLGTSASGKLA